MKRLSVASALLLAASLITGSLWLGCTSPPPEPRPSPTPVSAPVPEPAAPAPGPQVAPKAPDVAAGPPAPAPMPANLPEPRSIDAFMDKGLDWLASAQHPDGGWGG